MESIKKLKVIITAYYNTDNSWPGRVKCSFFDIHEKVHVIDDKVPVITELDLDENSEYPRDGYISCRVISVDGNVITIDINKPFSLEDENQETIFEVLPNQLS